MTDDYSPPRVWVWNKANGGEFASINRPIAGATHDKPLPVGRHPLQLYSLATPNGQKVTIMLEELLEAGHDAEYDAWLIRIGDGDQFGSGFVGANPNSKIPAMMDHTASPPRRVFESGAILLYLAEKFEAFLPRDPAGRTEALNWLFWQMGSAPFVGGGFGHFYAYAPVKIEYAIDRYAMETKRQLDVLDRHLAASRFMAGDEYSIADMAIWPWYGRLTAGEVYGDAATFLDGASYRHLARWTAEIGARPAVQRGVMVNRTSGEPSEQLWERHDASDFQTMTHLSLRSLQRSDVVELVSYLKEKGMDEDMYSELHHSSSRGRKEKFTQTIDYWSKDGEVKAESNLSFASRLAYVVSGHKHGGSWSDLKSRALALYPIDS